MGRQITISLIKIMNWTNTEQDTKIEISFLSGHTKAYVAHKSVIGSYIDNTILLDTSFKISYQENQHKLICKVAILKEYRTKQVVGEAEIDLECFNNRKIQYITFSDRDKVIQIHRVDNSPEEQRQNSHHQFVQRDQQSQHDFLQQRYNFLDKITNRQIELKKDFSQKVYNLLKDIKYARANESLRKEVQDKKITKERSEQHRYETPARENEDRAEMKRLDSKINQLEQKIALKNQGIKPTKQYKLMIDSIQAYGKKQVNREINNRDTRNYKEQNTEDEDEIIVPIKRANKEIRSIYKS